MTVMRSADLYKWYISRDVPLVAGDQAELDWRRIGTRCTDGPKWVADRRAIEAGAIADLRDWLAEIRACRIVSDQRWRIRLPTLVPGGRALQRQANNDVSMPLTMKFCPFVL